MDELQGDTNKWHKSILYQNYGYPPAQSTARPRPTAAPSSPARAASAPRPTTDTAEQKRCRLHNLFNTWVPRAVEFYNIYDTLDLTAEEVKAIQDEIIKYRVESAQAAGKARRTRRSGRLLRRIYRLSVGERPVLWRMVRTTPWDLGCRGLLRRQARSGGEQLVGLATEGEGSEPVRSRSCRCWHGESKPVLGSFHVIAATSYFA
jgi:hypothetical protein